MCTWKTHFAFQQNDCLLETYSWVCLHFEQARSHNFEIGGGVGGQDSHASRFRTKVFKCTYLDHILKGTKNLQGCIIHGQVQCGLKKKVILYPSSATWEKKTSCLGFFHLSCHFNAAVSVLVLACSPCSSALLCSAWLGFAPSRSPRDNGAIGVADPRAEHRDRTRSSGGTSQFLGGNLADWHRVPPPP